MKATTMLPITPTVTPGIKNPKQGLTDEGPHDPEDDVADEPVAARPVADPR
jgi:hypothetical protein